MKTTYITPEKTAHAIDLSRQLLNDSLEQMPHEITERLRAARMQALAQRVRPTQTEAAANTGFFAWLQRMPSITKGLITVPVLAAALMIGINLHAPNALSPDVALNNVFDAHTPNTLMQTNAANLDIDAILNEKVPLQAYLQDDFNTLVEQDALKNTAQPAKPLSNQKP